ncbi:STAS domain-containing protein [Mycolicibacterium psychrotolerans]|uniref:STAS domain-containing protein n=1 Tax=Mycolicibacterium psychrotolerans TaxID=216929 RepID=UPI003D674B2F
MSTARQFTDYVFRRAGNCRRLTLDMMQVTFFDCAGISALECIEERCGEADVALEIQPAPCVSRVMSLCQSLCA